MHILITGASSGLGQALALIYAKKGNILSLGGRHEGRLASVAEQAREKGAEVLTALIDVTNAWDMEDWIRQADKHAPLDLVIANAGISAGTGKGDETKGQALEVFSVNLNGVLNTLFPVLPLMKKRHKGQIAIMSSLAGFHGLPGAPAYCASKAAIRVYGESLRGEMVAYGIKVNVICPGFVKTPMTDVNDFKMPFLMSPEKAAKIIRKGLDSNKARIAFPTRLAILVWLLAALPACLSDHIIGGLPRKP